MRIVLVILGMLVTALAVWFLFGFALSRWEVNRRYREIERIQAIIRLVKQDPTDPTPLRELVNYADRREDWDRTQMFAQMRELGPAFQKAPQTRKVFDEILLPVIKKGLDDPSGGVRRESALAAGAFGPLSKPAMWELIQAIKKYPNEDTALFSAEALGEIGPEAREAIPAIEEVEKTWPGFEQTIERSLQKIRGDPKQ